MVVVSNADNNSASSSSSSNVSNHDVLVTQLDKVSKMKKDKRLTLPERIVEKDGTMNMINKPSWIWSNPFDFSNLLEMKWFSFLFIFALIYLISFLFFGLLYYSANSIIKVEEKAHEDEHTENSTDKSR